MGSFNQSELIDLFKCGLTQLYISLATLPAHFLQLAGSEGESERKSETVAGQVEA